MRCLPSSAAHLSHARTRARPVPLPLPALSTASLPSTRHLRLSEKNRRQVPIGAPSSKATRCSAESSISSNSFWNPCSSTKTFVRTRTRLLWKRVIRANLQTRISCSSPAVHQSHACNETKGNSPCLIACAGWSRSPRGRSAGRGPQASRSRARTRPRRGSARGRGQVSRGRRRCRR